MKKFLLSIIYLLTGMFYTKAQTLYGTTTYGGIGGGGTINQFTPATNNLTVVRSFESLDAMNPNQVNFIQAKNGKLYAMTVYGGSSDAGVIFSYDPSTSTYIKLRDFDYDNGGYPYGSLMQASDGKLYGMTVSGGSSGDGVIFSFDPSTSIYTKLKDFDNTIGGSPYGGLVQASNGKLYGMAAYGGNNGYGVIFSFDPSTSTYTKLKDFDNANGGCPYGSLVQAGNGKLYGMTYQGGISGYGVIFSFDPTTSTYTKLKDFDNTNGSYPYGSFLLAGNGKLYGMTGYGGSSDAGVIFSFDPSTSIYTKLKDFDFSIGSNPHGSFIQASDGKLYGLTVYGGTNSEGVVFSYDPLATTYTTLKNFDGSTDGGNPYGSLVQASNGKLYGMTTYGGNIGDGVIFFLEPSTSTYSKVRDFGTNEDGRNIYGGLLKAIDGKLYGMANEGGSSDAGVIFSFNPSTFTYTKLKEFDYTNGANPYGSLMQASNGKLYGMTAFGGSSDAGVIFSFDPATSIYTKLKDFDIANGANPAGSLLEASNGKLYGMTVFGGSSDYGVIFSFDPSTTTYTKFMDFNGTNGSNPYGSLVQKNDGKIYGLTAYGGINDAGVIFSFDPSAYTFAKLRDFDNATGSNPAGSLVSAKDGKLYGMTVSGGSIDAGVIFSFVPSSTYTKLKDFDNTNGGYPYGSLAQASDGKLYGMTGYGGSIDAGVVFSFDPVTSTYTKLQDFDITNGANPFLTSFIETAESGPVPVTLISFNGKRKGNSNQLTWKVENELNLNYYELQRSIDGQNFTGISQVKAVGNGTYIYNDQLAVTISPLYFYRLKSVDNDGDFKYSTIIKIGTDLYGKFVAVNPNPFQDKLNVTVESLIAVKATFIITDPGGRQLYKEDRQLSAGTNIVQISKISRLSKGTYLLTIIAGSHQRQSIKVVKGD
ncbi:MAG: T9SS type A sorting domain-containing protein [Bacteroidota bacterium]|nr:T9SS type A sorting domain-containing protein [Bacteroidota bacterium]